MWVGQRGEAASVGLSQRYFIYVPNKNTPYIYYENLINHKNTGRAAGP